MAKNSGGAGDTMNYIIEFVFLLVLLGALAASSALGAATQNALTALQLSVIGVSGLIVIIILFQILGKARKSFNMGR